MMWTFRITTGAIIHDGANVGTGYSGHGDGKGNPKLVAVPNIGPIPTGEYDIAPSSNAHPDLGPFVLALTPRDGTHTFGRSAFFIHGDSITNPGGASHGCICTALAVRHAIDASTDKILRVVE